jgi:acetyl-CoA carboxylase biotin carboxylase subunit
MKALNGKEHVKRVMSEAGLDVIPGSSVLESAQDALKAADEIGYPVMLKACSGGGGRGIRPVKSRSELSGAFMAAKAEAAAAFGNDAVYMEKCIRPARHIEIQVLADEAGNAVCLGERDCSIQRKNQKLVEESPSPAVTKDQRDAIFKKVARVVKHIGYTGVGTLEFLLDDAGHFYFMEMNVRLQVEHAVTESLTSIDLVKWQIRVSSGVALNFTQQDIDLGGSAIECRINARAPGKVEFLHVAGGPFVRFDTYLTTGSRITPHYDPLLGKLIIYAGSREEALRKMKAALCELVIDGVPNNIEEQIDIISSADFMSGKYNLNFFNK